MAKSVEISILGMKQLRLEESRSTVKGVLVKNIDTSVITEERKIILSDENNKVLSEIYLPNNALVIVDK
ncbi:hypothetical protein EJM73_19145 [Clostridium botulinum]|uniref:hypothetical protein n=1 Tax=Clostridium botulinum TaxID=1491 RepID=UPI0013755C43|nr:hypothetical protein [Clostridium botulinum]NCI22020.1 hypothetical protein [Clostridium botulinum]NCI37730.1 hypothetical protein [Clostridium botulinum]NCI74345.1 hypothetical protein [Clostridium botulinum]NDI40595.1 hypothetical protein [Clostridium botulinum]NFD96381.1 hypothetical protein [Clostridium botulinum]